MSEQDLYSLSLGSIGLKDRYDSILKEAPSLVAQKQLSVSRAAEAKRFLLGAGSSERLATAILEGNDLGRHPLAQEMATGDLGLIEQTYGPDVAAQARALRAEMANVERARTARGNLGRTVQDSALGVASGAVQGVGGVASLALGAINPDAGAFAAGLTQDAGEFINSGVSQSMQEKQRLGAIRGQLDQEDNNRQYEREVSRGEAGAGLRRAGREFVDALTDMAANPATTGQLVSEGIGSLVASMVMGGVIGKAAKAAFGASLSPTANMTTAIGLLEGGGMYSQIQAEIQNMSELDLMENSPEYVELRRNGISHEQARNQIANWAGLEGGATQAFIGALTGRLVARFEANPLKGAAGSTVSEKLASFGQNVLKEGTEELLQEGSANPVANTYIAKYADPDRDIWEGTGTAAAQGLAAGVGMAAALQGPSTAAGVAGNGVRARLDAVRSKDGKDRVAGSEGVHAAASQMTAGLRELRPLAPLPDLDPIETTAPQTQAPAEAPATPAQEPVEEPVIRPAPSLQEVVGWSDEDTDNLPQGVMGVIEAMEDDLEPSRPEIVVGVADAINKGVGSQQDRNIAAMWVASQIPELDRMKQIDLEALPAEAKTFLSDVITQLDTVREYHAIKDAVEKAKQMTSEDLGSAPTVTAENAASPEVQKAKTGQVLLAQVNPAGVNPDLVDGLLAQRRSAGISDRELRALKAAANLSREATKAEKAKTKLEEETAGLLKQKNIRERLRKTIEIVRTEILKTGFDASDMERGQPGLSRHQANVVEAVNQGDEEAAKDALEILGNFAQHLLNKRDAARESYKLGLPKGNEVKFRAWDGVNWIENGGAIGISPFSPNSVSLGKEVAIDAASAVSAYNQMVEAYPELGGKPLALEKEEAGESDDLVVVDRLDRFDREDTAAEGDTSNDDSQETSEEEESSEDQGEDAGDEDGSSDAEESPTERAQGRDGADDVDFVLVSPSNKIEMKAAKKQLRELKKEVRSILREQRELYNQDTKAKRPLMAALLKAGVRVDPTSPEAQELRARGVTSKSAPGLFKKNHRGDGLDNIVRKGIEYNLPGVTDKTGTDWGADYLDRDGVIDLLTEEVDGNGDWLLSRQSAAELEETIEHLEEQIDETNEEIEALEEEKRTGRKPDGKEKRKAERRNRTSDNASENKSGSDDSGGGADSSGERSQGSDQEAKDFQNVGKPEYLQKERIGDVNFDIVAGFSAFKDSGAYVDVDGKSVHIGMEDGRKIRVSVSDKGSFMVDLYAKKGANPITLDTVSEEDYVPKQRPKGKTNSFKISDLEKTNVPEPIKTLLVAFRDAFTKKPDQYLFNAHIYRIADTLLDAPATAWNVKTLREGKKFYEKKGNDVVAKDFKESLDALLAAIKELKPVDSNKSTPSEPVVVDDDIDESEKRFPSFKHLITKYGLNRFTRAFKIDTEQSLLMTVGNPFYGAVKYLENIANGTEPKQLDRAVDPARVGQLARGVKNEGERILQGMHARLNKEVYRDSPPNPDYDPSKPAGKDNRKTLTNIITPLEALASEKIDVLDQTKGKTLTLVDPSTGSYDPKLLEAAVVAAVDWVINTQTDRVPMTREDVAERRGKAPWDVTRAEMKVFNTSFRPETARESLARHIVEFWGAKGDGSVTISDVDGIPNALAAELLTVMAETGLVKEEKLKLEEGGNDVITVTIGRQDSKEWMKAINALGSHRTLIKDLFIPEHETKVYIDEVPETVVETQKGNPIGLVSNKQKDALRGEQAVKHMPTLMLDFMEDVGEETFLAMLGYDNADPETTHFLHFESIEGRNKGLKRDYKLTLEHWEKVKDYAAKNGKDPKNVATHYAYYLASNNRMYAKGHSGQANRQMRNGFAPTVSTLNVFDEDQMTMFWRAVGQMADIVKPELLFDEEINYQMADIEKPKLRFDEEINEQVADRMEEVFGPAIEVMERWLEDRELTDADRETLREVFNQPGVNQQAQVPHAVLAVAQYRKAAREGLDGGTFTTHLALESDGKTDGPFHAILHFLQRQFNPTQLKALRKGGLFLGNQYKSLADYYKSHEGVTEKDLYQFGATYFAQQFNALKTKMKNLPRFENGGRNWRPEAQMESLGHILALTAKSKSAAFGGVEMDDKGNLIIGRNVMKNPLTISLYGSGDAGIAANVASVVVDAINQAISDTLRMRQEYRIATGEKDASHIDIRHALFKNPDDHKDFYKHLRNMMSSRLYYSKRKDEYYVFDDIEMEFMNPDSKVKAPLFFRGDMSDAQLRKFEFTGPNFMMLKENIQTGFIAPMRHAINMVTDNAPKETELLLKTSNAQAFAVQRAFARAVQETLDEKRASGELTKNELLSRKDYQKVYEKVAPFAAIVGSVDGTIEDSRHINLSARGSGSTKAVVGRSFDGRWGEGISVSSPSDAGVKAMPLVTISEGDARMMTEMYAKAYKEGETLKTQEVFDGLEMPIDMAGDIQRRVNEADSVAVLGNIFREAADSFADFTRQDVIGLFDKEELVEFGKALGLEGDQLAEDKIVDNVNKEMVSTRQQMRDQADKIQARKEAMIDVGFTLEHMGGAGTAYVQEGRDPDRPSDEELADDRVLLDYLNKRMKHHLSKIQEERVEPEELDTKESSAALQVFYAGFPADDNGVRTMNIKQLAAAMDKMMLTDDHKAILSAMRKSLVDFTVHVGDSLALTKLRDKRYPKWQGEPLIEQGLADMDNRVLYLSSKGPETALHEMVHASIGATIMEYYDDPALVDETSRTAIQNLEKLMRQFINMSFEREADEVADAGRTAQEEILNGLVTGSNNGKAMALNEFVAWTLTNGELARTLKKTRNHSKLTKLVHEVGKVLRRLLGVPAKTSLDMFSNIQWNTAAIMHMSANSPHIKAERARSYGMLLQQRHTDKNLRELRDTFERKIAAHLRVTHPDFLDTAADIDQYDQAILNLMHRNGIHMSQAEESTFRSIQRAMATQMEMDKGSLVHAQKMFNKVLKEITVEKLMDDASQNDPTDRTRAENLFNVLTGKVGISTDSHGRSSMLSTFIALSQVNPQVRRMMRNTFVPARPGIKRESVDEYLSSTANRLMDDLAQRAAGNYRYTETVKDAMDRLAAQLAKIEADDRTYFERQANSLLETGDAKFSQFLSDSSNKIWDFADANLQGKVGTIKGEVTGILRGGVKAVGAVLDADKGDAYAKAITSMLNKVTSPLVPKTLIGVVGEVVGINDENRPVKGMMNMVKAGVSAMRQENREKLPKFINKQFKIKVSKELWQKMHMFFGRTDLGAIVSLQHSDDILAMLSSDTNIDSAVEAARAEMQTAAGNDADYKAFLDRSEALARFMVGQGIAKGDHGLLTNALAISMRLDKPKPYSESVAEAAVPAIDRYVSLLALQKAIEADPKGMEQVRQLIVQESEGVKFTLVQLYGMREKEKAKTTSIEARLNGYKGYIPSESQSGTSLLVAPDSEQARLEQLGYSRLGDYVSDFESGRKGYYLSTVAGNATFTQGVMQTVQKTYNGVSMKNGRTATTGTTGGRLNRVQTAQALARIRRGARVNRGQPLVPRYNKHGQISAFERSMDPEVIEAMKSNTRLDEMIGAWRGRQMEEDLATEYNQQLVDNLKAIWDRDKLKRADEFIDLSDPTLENQLHKDAWGVIPIETKEYIKKKFGTGNGFMVRKDMLDNAVGYRALSAGEAWDGPSDLPEPVKATIRGVTEFVLGKKAYPYLVTAEKAWQAGISVAKNTIVIRSIMVPASNIASNVLQLMTLGVPLRDIGSGFKTKLVEIDKYLKNLERMVEIDAELNQYTRSDVQYRKLTSEKRSLEDSNRRMSIWPLIEAGEFSTISGGPTEADAALTNGKWADYIRDVMERSPAQLGTVGRYAAITKDTALFQGMSRAVQYGDFLAKAVLYDHLTKRKGLEGAKAMEDVTEEFVNYNLLAPRLRAYSESIGAMWFWAYKLRSMKRALNIIRRNPLRAMMTTFALPEIPIPVGISVGSPMTDNAGVVIADGRAGYSIGLGMLWNAFFLNPWANLVR